MGLNPRKASEKLPAWVTGGDGVGCFKVVLNNYGSCNESSHIGVIEK
ncbi:hypothetical protein [Streptococcus phage SVep1]|nr:hypothetical protein [Streptococcus phage SVep1]DAS10115.1 MAG TPA: central kinetochore subunit [Caudoviricetes sp.]DAZ58581.1 MAG TPA: central kinetochore subunit [Caudoviricetes sp.]